MSRAAAAILVLALTGALGLAPRPQPLGGDSASAAACAWQRHSKRIVKQVKRNGRAHRVVRQRHWWTCNPLALPPTIGTAPAPTSQPAPEPGPAVARLSVKAAEYSFTLSRPSIAPGEAIVELNNQGEDPHNLQLQRLDGEDPQLEVPEAGPLEHRVGRFSLAAGTYRLWCSLEQHDELGMNATLVVGSG